LAISTTTALSINPAGGSLTTGSSYTLTATVSPSSGSTSPTGSVVFNIGSATQTAVLNSSGVATYTGTAPATAGGLALSAAYQGSMEFSASTSTTLNETVLAISTTTALSINPAGGSLTAGSAYTLTATVSPMSGSTTPTGSIVFNIGAATQTVALNSSGAATYIGTAPAAAGGLELSAAYQGSMEFSPSTSTTLIETVTIPVFTISGAAVDVAAGATTGNTSTISVTPAGGFTGVVALTAAITSSPAGAQNLPTLSFGSTTPLSINSTSSGTATLTIYTTPASSASSIRPSRTGSPWLVTGGATLACILFLGIPRRRRSWRQMLGLLVFLVFFASGILSCGGSGSNGGGGGGSYNSGTTSGAYTITVTGTSGSTTATGTVTLNVQ
jgi:trimeric autotransporter adhesin